MQDATACATKRIITDTDLLNKWDVYLEQRAAVGASKKTDRIPNVQMAGAKGQAKQKHCSNSIEIPGGFMVVSNQGAIRTLNYHARSVLGLNHGTVRHAKATVNHGTVRHAKASKKPNGRMNQSNTLENVSVL